MTGEPVELITFVLRQLLGSGFNTIVSFDKNFEQPPKVIESMAIRVIRQFDLVVVRGNKSKEFLARRGIEEAVAIITGSVNGCTQPIKSHREIDLIFVGRLCPFKQVHQFIAVVHAIRRIMPNIRAAIVGDGPLMASLRACAERLGLTDNIKFFGKRKDVETLLVCSKIFVLTSRSEGLSIAVAEAMAAGTVPVVADVGELGDLVVDGVNGHLVEPNNIDEYTKRIVSLLQDQALWKKYSLRATEDVKIHCDIEVVSGKWRHHLQEVVSQASGLCMQEVMN
jgi:glycosyltransferase involved in cell wall biosynthesis